MAETQGSDWRNDAERARTIAMLLDIAGWAVLIVSVAIGGFVLYQLSQAEAPGWMPVVWTVAGVVGGICFAVLLWGLAEAIRGLNRPRSAAPPRPDFAVPPPRRPLVGDAGVQLLEEIRLLLREVRDISLLSEEQRRMRLEAQGRAALKALQREVPQLLREHNWIEARRRVQEARERFPSFPEWDELENRIEQMRNQVEQHDIESAERQIRDLVNLGAWDRVADVVKELLERHPESEKAQALAQRVRTERQQAESGQRTQMMERLRELVKQREWEQAEQLATQIIERFPSSPEAQALRMDLPMLRANAEIKLRQRLEQQFRELYRQRRFDEALHIARTVVDRYPHSPQAKALREQLPKLEELAATMFRR